MLQTVPLPVKPWLPDLGDLNNPGSPNVVNAIPFSEGVYGPMYGLNAYSTNGLTARCQGAAAFIDTSASVYIFAGDANDLYLLKVGSAAWSKVSKVAGGYSTPSDAQWHFEYFNGRVIATNGVDPIQSFTVGSSTAFADLAAAAPKAKYLATTKGFLIAANTNDSVNGACPQRVWWPALNDPTNWPTPGGVTAAEFQSSYNDLFGTGGFIQGIAGNLGNADAAIFQEHMLWRATYSGPPSTFEFFPAAGMRGCSAPGSIIALNGIVYYLGEDGFYAFDGAQSDPIGANKVDKTFWADVDPVYLLRMSSGIDPINRQVWWSYCGQGNGGVPNRLLVYQWQLRQWGIVEITVQFIARLLSIGYTLDQLYTVLGYTIDNLPAPLDSRVWLGGATVLGLFDTNNKLNFATGPTLSATVDTAEANPVPGYRSMVGSGRPLVDGGTPSMAIGTRERQVDAVSFTAPTALNSFGICPQRTSGRYIRSRIVTKAGDSWTKLLGVELMIKRAGAR
jgi:hypothetical protein